MSKDVLKLALEALEWDSDFDKRQKARAAIKQALEQPVAMDEVRELSDGFIENPEAIKYLLDCLRWAQGEDGLPQTHYNFICAFQRKGYAVLQRLNEDYGPEWTFSKHATTPPAAQPAPVQPVAMRMPKVGDRVVCIDDESLGTVVYLTAGGSPEIKFDDGSHGTYMVREFAELFGYTHPSPAQEFICSTGLCHYKPAAAVQPTKDVEISNMGKPFTVKAYVTPTATQPAPVQEQQPYAYANPDELSADSAFRWCEINEYTMPVYTTPPAAQRPWVKLTDMQVGKVIDDVHTSSQYGHHHTGFWMDFYRAIEAKLKELNT
jgi:hypothetical protein